MNSQSLNNTVPTANQSQVQGEMIIARWTQDARLLLAGAESRSHQDPNLAYADRLSAVNLLRQVLYRNSENVEAIVLMAQGLEALGRLEEAVKCRRALVRIAPTVENRIHSAHLLYRTEADEDALKSYQELLSDTVIPEDQMFDVQKNLGNLYVRKGDYEAAEDHYNRAFAIDPRSDALLVNFGTLEIQRDQLDAGAERFKKALEINSQNDKAWVGLALVHRAKGDFELSWGNLARAIDINPRNRTALRLLAEWGARDSKLGVAIEAIENYLSLESEDAEMAFLLVKCLSLLGRFSEALIECEQVVTLDPENQEASRLRRELARRVLGEKLLNSSDVANSPSQHESTESISL